MWRQPNVGTLKRILKRSIFGIELQKDSLHLASFSLALAVCEFLKPPVIWNNLQFDRLEGENLVQDDFFAYYKKSQDNLAVKFDVVIGNPPFLSVLTDAAKQANTAAQRAAKVAGLCRGTLPDNQMAYLVAEQAVELLKKNGRLCLIQPVGLLYNEKARTFQRYFLSRFRTDYILDCTSIRGLFGRATTSRSASREEEEKLHTADTKFIVMVVSNEAPLSEHQIRHLTFRRTFTVKHQIGFELDHYDYHLVSQHNALNYPYTWKANLLGGGRLHFLAARLHEMDSISSFLEKQNLDAGEGYIVGNSGERERASWLTGKALLPSTALLDSGIDEAALSVVTDKEFSAPRKKFRYQAPLMLIRENEKLQCDFWERGFLAYKAQIVGIVSKVNDRRTLHNFFLDFKEQRHVLVAFCLLLGTRALVGKATAINKRDIVSMPWPGEGESWDLSFWEKILCDDLVNYMADYVRLGHASPLLQNAAADTIIEEYCMVFKQMLGSIYHNLQVGKCVRINGLICQMFHFGEQPQEFWASEVNSLNQALDRLVYIQSGESLRTARIVRLYHSNVIVIVKPDRHRYWIESTAIRDADETLVDLAKQGY